MVFNRTGESDARPLLVALLESCHFDMICFVPNVASADYVDPNQSILFSIADTQLKRAQIIADLWQQLATEQGKPNHARTYPTVLDAFIAMRQRYAQHIELDVLITGSLHLLGAAITALNRFPPIPP